MTVLLLMLWRALRRGGRRASPAGVHVLLYVCLFVQPLTGYLGSAYSGYPVEFFGLMLPACADLCRL